MAFERIHKQTHIIAGTTVRVCYDRFTSRFEIKSESEVIYSSLLLLLPIKNVDISINKQKFTLKIRWFILWQSTLVNSTEVVVSELLYRRRKKSINLFIYFMLISSIKIAIGLTAQ